MRIAFDSQIFAMQKHGGISRYICNLAQGLSLDSAVNVKVVAPLHINAYLSDLPSKLVYGKKVPVIRGATKLLYAANLALSWRPTTRFRPSVVHQTYYLPITYAPKGARRVVTVYDMIHERFADVFSMNRSHTALKRKAVFKADHVICISECTRRDLLEIFNISADKVSVAHLGFDRLTESMHPMERTPDIGERPYILYVGQRSGYKNFSGFLRAFASSEWLRRNFGIICFGGGSLQADERRLISELGIPQYQVSQTGGSDGKLAMCYRSAAALIYPSLYEGFGIPPLEAMSLDCPVICSDTSSLPEVVGAAAEYFNPYDTDSMRSALECTLGSSERCRELVKLGRERFVQFTWDRCTGLTLEKYRSLL